MVVTVKTITTVTTVTTVTSVTLMSKVTTVTITTHNCNMLLLISCKGNFSQRPKNKQTTRLLGRLVAAESSVFGGLTCETSDHTKTFFLYFFLFIFNS